MNKRVLIALGSILGLIIVIVVFIVIVNSRSKAPSVTDQNTDQTNQDTNQTTPKTNPDQLTKISDASVIAPILSYDGKASWFFTVDGHLYKLNLSTGLKQEYLLPTYLGITDAIWPLNGNDFIVVTGTGASKVFNYYNSETKVFSEYPSNVKAVDFTPDGKHVVYNWVSGAKSTLSIADPNLKNFQNVLDLPAGGLTLKVSALGNKVFAYDHANSQDGRLNLINLDSKKLVTIRTSQDNEVVWSPDGKKFVYNRDPDGKTKDNSLWLGDSEEVTNKKLNINGGVSKVVFDQSGENLYVSAVGIDDQTESIWKIDLQTLQKTKVFKVKDLITKIDASDLLISPDSQTLYFKNSDGFLYSVTLSKEVK
ncbi:MAG: WD40 repeat domain-containing protein [Patescibacteria group bacterium]